jgi:hypothetical protein
VSKQNGKIAKYSVYRPEKDIILLKKYQTIFSVISNVYPNSTLTLARCRADYSALGGPPATPAGGVAAA